MTGAPGTFARYEQGWTHDVRSRQPMSFADAFQKVVAPHVDTPAQAEARANAVAKVQARKDAKASRTAARRAGQKGPEAAPTAAGPDRATPHP
jgi:hypothetical protein